MWTELLSAVVVTPARGDDQRTALSILLLNLDEDDRELQLQKMLESDARGDLSLDGLLLARLHEVATGALLFTVQSDASAYVWPPVIARTASSWQEAVSMALLEQAVELIRQQNCWIAHSILSADDPKMDVMHRAGFEKLVALQNMEHNEPGALTETYSDRLERVSYSPSAHERFQQVVRQTYVDTQDCPEIVGLRTADEALEGHRLAGDSSDSLWYLYQSNGEDVAVLLIAEDSKFAEWEISYLGVVPDHRRRGLARRITIEALNDAQSAGMQSVTLSVDERNGPAIDLYRALGFQCRSHQVIHALKILR